MADSTRTLYKKKLAILLRENEAKDKVDGEEPQNGHEEPVIVTPEPPKRVSTRSRTSTKSTNGGQAAAEFSADEEVVSEEDEEQPAIVVKKSTRASVTPKKTTSASSPSQSIGVSLRQRFTGMYVFRISIFEKKILFLVQIVLKWKLEATFKNKFRYIMI